MLRLLFITLTVSSVAIAIFGSIEGKGNNSKAAAAITDANSIHDLAVTMIEAPLFLDMTPDNPSEARVVSVGILNRSDHDEVINPDKHRGNGLTTGLVRLKVTVIDNDNERCEPAKVVIRPPAPVDRAPTRIKTMQGYGVTFDVTYRCTNPRPRDSKDPTPWDYSYSATVHHEVLDGNPDSDPSDDICPRQPAPSKRDIQDKGCGWKLRGQPFGPNVTDVVLKPAKKP